MRKHLTYLKCQTYPGVTESPWGGTLSLSPPCTQGKTKTWLMSAVSNRLCSRKAIVSSGEGEQGFPSEAKL